ncbi:Double zinc ribbon [Phycisphaerae bacterium RAS1]|nr:Double zinc ribbon [Phycisphaerae bacterium RAS1]
MRSQTQRWLLSLLILSICLSGLLGILVLLTGGRSWFEVRILLTTAAIGAASIVGLAAAAVHEARRWTPLGAVGMGATGVALAMTLIVIWVDSLIDVEAYTKTWACAIIASIGLTHVGLLALARLRRQFEFARGVTILAIVTLALQIAFLIVTETDAGDFWARLIGVNAIIDVCGTIAVPILHRISDISKREAIVTTALAVQLTCPRCGRPQQVAVGGARCGGCGLGIKIEIEEEHCPSCGYPLYQLTSAACPECGAPIAPPRPAGT